MESESEAGVVGGLPEQLKKVANYAGRSLVRVGRHGGRGSGLVVFDNLVLTCAHNLRGPQVSVTFSDGQVRQASLKGVDPENDLAVVEVDTAGAAPASWEPEGVQVELGQPIFAANLRPGGALRVAAGAVCASPVSFRGPQGSLVSDAFEHTAPVGQGCSGGPALDDQARLVGLNVLRLEDGFYVALRADAKLRAKVERLAQGESPRRRRLGVGLVPSATATRMRAAVGLAPQEGALVREVVPDSPAAKAGLRRGDLVIAIGDRLVRSPDELSLALEALPDEAQVVAMRVLRGTEELELTLSWS